MSTSVDARPHTPWWRTKPVILTVFWVVLLGAMVAGTRFVGADEEIPTTGGGLGDPAVFVDGVYDSEIVPYLTDHATELTELLPQLRTDVAGTRDALGLTGGSEPYSFAVRATGTLTEGEFGQVGLDIPGLPAGTSVGIQTGPVLLGNAIRDAVGVISFDETQNQIEFYNVAVEINNIVRERVTGPADLASRVGRQVTVIGAFTYDDPTHITITPISVEES